MNTRHAAYTGDDFYCDVALGNVGDLDVVAETPGVLAYHHTKPFWQTHVVVVPKLHVQSLTTLTSADEPMARELLKVITHVAARLEREHGAARVLTNLGDYQDSKHLHVHVSSGEQIS